MPRYTYRCTNTSCQHRFEVEKPAAEAQALAFCPQCQSLTQRDFSDFRSVSFQVQQGEDGRYYVADAHQPPHAHHASCGCAAFATDWEARIKAIDAEEKEMA